MYFFTHKEELQTLKATLKYVQNLNKFTVVAILNTPDEKNTIVLFINRKTGTTKKQSLFNINSFAVKILDNYVNQNPNHIIWDVEYGNIGYNVVKRG